jgi:osmotically-inducible protein OsmY
MSGGPHMAVRQLTNTDRRIRDAVVQQLQWDPAVEATTIHVAVHNRVVILTGVVDSLHKKFAAERAAKAVRGVRAVANDLEVRPSLARAHADVAADAVHALALRGTVPFKVQARVQDGHITLTGQVDRLFQRTEAEEAVRRIKGVRDIHNQIEVVSDIAVRDVRERIAEALRRSADVDAKNISVSVKGHVATLRGTVPACGQRDAAERAVANATGITRVDNRIRVEPVDELC